MPDFKENLMLAEEKILDYLKYKDLLMAPGRIREEQAGEQGEWRFYLKREK